MIGTAKSNSNNKLNFKVVWPPNFLQKKDVAVEIGFRPYKSGLFVPKSYDCHMGKYFSQK